MSSSPRPLISGNIEYANLIRGGLPVHRMKHTSEGIPFIHSTDLKRLMEVEGLSRIKARTRQFLSGKISGPVILLPRVGKPNYNYVKAISLNNDIQLSDCVFALECQNFQSALSIEHRIKDNWPAFIELYKGTAARYVTKGRLKEWLWTLDIVVC